MSKVKKVRVKILTGETVFCQCRGKGKNRRCKPKGQTYKFPGYYYVWMELAPQTKIATATTDAISESI